MIHRFLMKILPKGYFRTQTQTRTRTRLVQTVNRLSFHLSHNKPYDSDVLRFDKIRNRKQQV